MHVFQRTLKDLDKLDPSTTLKLGDYIDLKDKAVDRDAVTLLREQQDDMIPKALGKNAGKLLTKYEPLEWVPGGIDPSNGKHAHYLRSFLDDFCHVVLDSLDCAQEKLAVEPDPVADECRFHLLFAKVREVKYTPTPSSEQAFERVRVYLKGPGGRPVVVFGPSGAGKTYVMAKATTEAAKATTKPYVVVRFLGTSPKSSNVFDLLASVYEQLRRISLGFRSSSGAEGAANEASDDVDKGEASNVLPLGPTNFEALRSLFKDTLEKWSFGPLMLILDSVDQLDDTDGGRRLDWLPVKVSDHVHFVISTLPDYLNPEVGSAFRCLSILAQLLVPPQEKSSLANPAEILSRFPDTFVKVEPLKEAGQLLAHLLKLQGRRVTDAQRNALVSAVAKSDQTQTPLMVTILAAQASEWHSYNSIPEIKSSVREIIIAFFQQLEREHGEELVRAVIAFITLAKQGLSETELQEVLSLMDDVLNAVFQW